MSIENLFNLKWKAQFDTESRLKKEVVPVKGIHLLPALRFR